MKILFYSDTHLREQGSFIPYNRISENGFTSELNNFVKGFHFVRDKIEEIEPDLVCHLGDHFQLTEANSTPVYHAHHMSVSPISDLCRKMKIDHLYLLGNHDVLSEDCKIYTTKCLSGWTKHIDEDLVYDLNGFRISFIPYTSSYPKAYSSLVEAQLCSDLICTHLDFSGCFYENMQGSFSPLSPELTRPCISGHIHLAQTIGSVNYVGSLVQHRFSNYDISRVGGVLVYDTDSKEVVRHPNTYSKHYVKLRDLDALKGLPPERVLLQVISSKSKEEIEPLLEGYEYFYIRSVEEKRVYKESGYQEFSLENPEEVLRSHVSSENPDALATYDSIVKNQRRNEPSELQ